jgi:hypothetical protein
MAKRKYKKAVVKEPEPESEAEEVIEEILEEVPEAEVVVEERELPQDTGEETSEIKSIGGRMMRVVKTSKGVTYHPL